MCVFIEGAFILPMRFHCIGFFLLCIYFQHLNRCKLIGWQSREFHRKYSKLNSHLECGIFAFTCQHFSRCQISRRSMMENIVWWKTSRLVINCFWERRRWKTPQIFPNIQIQPTNLDWWPAFYHQIISLEIHSNNISKRIPNNFHTISRQFSYEEFTNTRIKKSGLINFRINAEVPPRKNVSEMKLFGRKELEIPHLYRLIKGCHSD